LKIIPVKGHRDVYTSNVYMIQGDWKRIADINTLIDVGNDPSIIEAISAIDTGVGKKKVEQVILTHGHSDHTGILPLIIKEYDPVVYAYSPFMEGVTQTVRDGAMLRIGENNFEIIHTPGHSSDSISLYNEDHQVLFVGDTPVIIRRADSWHEKDFVNALKKLCQKKVKSIYFGHGDPVLNGGHSLLIESLSNIRNSTKKDNHFLSINEKEVM
jgi:glyoxylase-like metal-dependent hydrolase (beta-lactamase superfamily II)